VRAIDGQNVEAHVTRHTSHVTRHTSPALNPATNRVTRTRRRRKLDLHRRLQQRLNAAHWHHWRSTLTFCPAGTVPLAGSAVNPSALASAGTSNANSPGSFAPQLPTTTSADAATPVLSPTTSRSVFVEPTAARCERGTREDFITACRTLCRRIKAVDSSRPHRCSRPQRAGEERGQRIGQCHRQTAVHAQGVTILHWGNGCRAQHTWPAPNNDRAACICSSLSGSAPPLQAHSCRTNSHRQA
jgi:hypothetical protein